MHDEEGNNFFENKMQDDIANIFKTWIQAGLSNALFKRVLDQIPAGIIMLGTDEIVLVANETAMNLFNHQILIGEKLSFTLFRIDRTPYLYADRPPIRTLRTGKGIQGEDAIFIDQKGNEFFYSISSNPIYNFGELIAVVVVIQDITTKIKIMNALSDSEERFRSMFEYAATGMAILTPEGNFVMVNNALCNILGYSVEEFSKLTVSADHLWIKENNRILRRYKKLLRGEITRFQVEEKLVHKGGRVIWGLISMALVRNTAGNPFYLICQIQDITKLKKVEKNLRIAKDKAEVLASTDYLTGLLNRRAFMNRLKEQLTDANRKNSKLSLIMADVDFFKKINDTYGHTTGDAVLIKFAGCLTDCCKAPCFAGRYGGEEFIIGLPGVTLEQAGETAEKIRSAAAQLELKSADGLYNLRMTASFGVAMVDCTGIDTTDLLIRWADKALYQAKIEGRNRVCLAQPVNAHLTSDLP